MPVNGYFNNFPSQNRMGNEHLLMEDVLDESIKIMGHDCYYILRESLDSIDYIFGEATKVKLHHAYLMECYIANVEGFEGQGDFFTKFGLEIRDTTNLICSRRSFAKNVPSTFRDRPREGDLLYVPLMHRIFEIKFIEKKLTFFSLGNRHPYIYEMRAEDFRYSQEKIETGIEEIDHVEEDNAYTVRLNLAKTGSGSFEESEHIYQVDTDASARVKEWYAANGTMFVYEVRGVFANNSSIRGNTSNALFTVESIGDLKTDYVDQDLYDNKTVHDEASVILDLNELNPFGAI